jgi:hypothetical protein
MKIVFWDVTLYSLVDIYLITPVGLLRVPLLYSLSLYLHQLFPFLAYSFTLKMEEAHFSETLEISIRLSGVTSQKTLFFRC